MPRKRYSTEQIVTKLRQAEVEFGRGLRTPEMCKELGGSEQTSYRWRKEYGGLHLSRHHVWADDFGAERTHAGRPVKILAGVDEYSRECLALVVARQLRSIDVLDLTP